MADRLNTPSRYTLFVTALKIEAQFQLMMLAVGFIYFFKDPSEQALSIFAAILTFLLLLCGYCGVTWEKEWMMYVFGACSFLEPAYIVYKIWMVELDASKSAHEQRYSNVWKLPVLTLGVTTVIVRVVVTFYALRCYHNFGKGLLKAFAKSDPRNIRRDELLASPRLRIKGGSSKGHPTAVAAATANSKCNDRARP